MNLFLEFLLCLVALALSIFWEYRTRNKVPIHIKDDEEMRRGWNLTRFNTLVILPPVIEEIIFRGPLLIFFDALSRNSIIAILLVGTLFAVVHNTHHGIVHEHEWKWSNTKKILLRILPQFFGGITCGVTAIWLQSLLIAVAIHILWNLLVWLRMQFIIIEDEYELELSQLYALKCKFDAWRSKHAN